MSELTKKKKPPTVPRTRFDGTDSILLVEEFQGLVRMKDPSLDFWSLKLDASLRRELRRTDVSYTDAFEALQIIRLFLVKETGTIIDSVWQYIVTVNGPLDFIETPRLKLIPALLRPLDIFGELNPDAIRNAGYDPKKLDRSRGIPVIFKYGSESAFALRIRDAIAKEKDCLPKRGKARDAAMNAIYQVIVREVQSCRDADVAAFNQANGFSELIPTARDKLSVILRSQTSARP